MALADTAEAYIEQAQMDDVEHRDSLSDPADIRKSRAEWKRELRESTDPLSGD